MHADGPNPELRYLQPTLDLLERIDGLDNYLLMNTPGSRMVGFNASLPVQ